jgi:hypothetical protein
VLLERIAAALLGRRALYQEDLADAQSIKSCFFETEICFDRPNRIQATVGQWLFGFLIASGINLL